MNYRFFKEIIFRLVLVVGSLIVTYVVIEFVLFKPLMIFLPLKTHIFVDEGIRVLCQNSKRSTIPKNYIALMGDSYAQGAGDWFLNSDPNRNPAFHSAHVLYEKTGRDIISFGAGGRGSLGGLVAEPIHQFEYMNKTYLYKIASPRVILVYFYEGNDLDNNLSEIQERYIAREYDVARIYDEAYFKDFIARKIHRAHTANQKLSFKAQLFFTKFLIQLLKNGYEEDVRERYQTARPVGSVNRAIINGEEVPIPDRLQSPALELTDDELLLSVYSFEQALAYLQEYFPQTKIGVVYIPSPLASYHLSSSKVSIRDYEKRQEIFDREFVKIRSDRISTLVENAARKHQIGFVDSREFIWRYTSKEFLHGPLDWKHLNKRGYHVLTEAVITLLERMGEIQAQ